jgi:hypothetical protein
MKRRNALRPTGKLLIMLRYADSPRRDTLWTRTAGGPDAMHPAIG